MDKIKSIAVIILICYCETMRVLDLTVLVNRAALSVMISTQWFIRFYFIFVDVKIKIPSVLKCSIQSNINKIQFTT